MAAGGKKDERARLSSVQPQVPWTTEAAAHHESDSALASAVGGGVLVPPSRVDRSIVRVAKARAIALYWNSVAHHPRYLGRLEHEMHVDTGGVLAP